MLNYQQTVYKNRLNLKLKQNYFFVKRFVKNGMKMFLKVSESKKILEIFFKAT